MSQPVTAAFSDFLFMLEGNPGSGNYNQAPLAMTTRGFTTTVSTTKITVPNQSNEDAVVAEQAVPNTITRSCTGKGILGTADYKKWEGRLKQTFNIQVSLDGVGTWTGPVILTQLNISGERTNVLNVDVTMEQADDLVFEPED